MQAVASSEVPKPKANLASAMAGVFWFFISLKSVLIFLLFQSDPPFGTFVVGLVSLCFGLFLTSYLVVTERHIRRSRFEMSLTAKLLFTFCGWMAVTVAWSQADSNSTALAYWAMAAVDVAVAFVLLRLGPMERVALASFRGIIYGSVVAGAIILFLTAGTGDNRIGDGQFLSPNVVGNQVAMACLIGIYLVTRKRAGTIERPLASLATLFLFVTLLQTLSKTSIISFAVAVFIFILSGRIAVWQKVLVFVTGVAITLASYATLESYWSFYSGELQGGTALDTVSGRTILWARTWEMIIDNPVVGYGLLAFRDMGPQIASVRVVQAHNEVLHTWFSYGILGLTIAIAVYMTHAVQIWRVRGVNELAERVTLAAPLLAYCIARGVTEASFVGLVYPMPLLLVITIWLQNSSQQDAKPS